MRLSELVDDLVYLARSLGVTSEQLAEFVVDHYEYVSTNPDEKTKLAQMLRNRRMRF